MQRCRYNHDYNSNLGQTTQVPTQCIIGYTVGRGTEIRVPRPGAFDRQLPGRPRGPYPDDAGHPLCRLPPCSFARRAPAAATRQRSGSGQVVNARRVTQLNTGRRPRETAERGGGMAAGEERVC
jgi:hypothetical protein